MISELYAFTACISAQFVALGIMYNISWVVVIAIAPVVFFSLLSIKSAIDEREDN